VCARGDLGLHEPKQLWLIGTCLPHCVTLGEGGLIRPMKRLSLQRFEIPALSGRCHESATAHHHHAAGFNTTFVQPVSRA